ANELYRDLKLDVQLSEQKKLNTEAIIYSIRDAVLVADNNDRIVMANNAAGKLFKFDFEHIELQMITELVGVNQKEFIEFFVNARKSKSQATRRELNFMGDDGVRTFDCIVSCIYDKKGQVCGAVAVLHDITREKEVSQMKNDFVSHVSHELKTPLASILAYSEMLNDGEANDEQTRQEFYSVIQTQAKRLNRLIEDILNISRIESGLVKVEKKPISLSIAIQEQLQMIRGYAEEKDIKVISPEPIIFDQVYVDKDMISQVIVNLLSNAVKYTRSGGKITIDTQVNDADKTVTVSITDTGVGIPAEEIEHVFDKFYRVAANNKQAKGTGLGLNLVKQIVEKVHGGKVFVQSEKGVGSTFGFELPLATRELVESM
ncbi:MAG TPA: ATP-binding protein, partial [Sedimentisphaerales bacterium]|nr:ATP-binding protein [Sedimentisphaerales bacterium]